MISKEINYNLHYDDVRGDFFTAATWHNTSNSRKNKSQKGLPLETKNTQNHENQRLGLIRHVNNPDMLGCSLVREFL